MIDPTFNQAAAAHDAEFERLHAPWNRDDAGPPPVCCELCGGSDAMATGATACDPCLVANAERCGDWDDESVAALDREIERTKTTP